MKILVTGHKGFIGRALYSRLLDAGHEVRGFDLPENNLLDGINGNFVADVVIHLAAVADLNETAKDIKHNFEVNVIGTRNIVDYCHTTGARLLYVSTCCAWGNCDTPSCEDRTLPKPTEPYAISKLAAEWVIRCFPVDCMIYRIGTVYGPGMRPALFNYVAMDKIHRNEMIEIHGDGHQDRQYIYIDDLVDAFEAGLENWQSRQVFSVCGEDRISVVDTIRMCEMLHGKAAKVRHIPDRGGQIMNEDISIEKAKLLLGWAPKTTYQQGMDKAWQWYMSKGE